MTPQLPISEPELDQFVRFITENTEDAGPPTYPNCKPALICIEAVLSINRPYDSFVVPRLKAFAREYPQIVALAALRDLIGERGVAGFCDVWRYRHPARVEMVEALVDWFIAYGERHGIDDDLCAMRHWANAAPGTGVDTPERARHRYRQTRQYLRMLVGADTVKPDRHILNAIKDAIGRSVSADDAILIVEAAARRLSGSAAVLDYRIWRAYAEKAARQRTRAAASCRSR